MSFHERLKVVLREHGISQAELAYATGISQPNISRLLHGMRAPSLLTMTKVVAALPDSVDVRRLLLG